MRWGWSPTNQIPMLHRRGHRALEGFPEGQSVAREAVEMNRITWWCTYQYFRKVYRPIGPPKWLPGSCKNKSSMRKCPACSCKTVALCCSLGVASWPFLHEPRNNVLGSYTPKLLPLGHVGPPQLVWSAPLLTHHSEIRTAFGFQMWWTGIAIGYAFHTWLEKESLICLLSQCKAMAQTQRWHQHGVLFCDVGGLLDTFAFTSWVDKYDIPFPAKSKLQPICYMWQLFRY